MIENKKTINVGYLGPPGTYSHQVCQYTFFYHIFLEFFKLIYLITNIL